MEKSEGCKLWKKKLPPPKTREEIIPKEEEFISRTPQITDYRPCKGCKKNPCGYQNIHHHSCFASER